MGGVVTTIGQSSGSVSDAIPWVLALLAMAVLGALVLFALRRRLLRDGERSDDETFSLEELRCMRAAGELTEEEFESARAVIIGGLSARSGGATPGRNPITGAMRATPGRDLAGDRIPRPDGDSPE